MKKLFLIGCSALAVMTFSQTVFAAATGERGWVQERNTWKYYKTQTEASRGWLSKDNNWYYLNEQTGVMETGWKFIGGAWYFLDTRAGKGEGIALKGWQWIDGYCYYFVTDKNANEAKLLVNTKTPDGFTVDENGRWTENGKVQYRPGYGIITKKAVASGTKFRSGGGSGGSSGGGSSSGGSSGNSGGSNIGSNQGNTGGENQGNNQGGNAGGENQGNNGGGNAGGENQGNSQGGNTGGESQGNNGGGNTGGENQGNNGGGNSGDAGQGNNDAQPVPRKAVPITYINEVIGSGNENIALLPLEGDLNAIDTYFDKVISVKLNGMVIEKAENFTNTPAVGKFSYADGFLVFNISNVDTSEENNIEIEAEGYEDYISSFRYIILKQSPIQSYNAEVVSGERVKVSFEGDEDEIAKFLRQVTQLAFIYVEERTQRESTKGAYLIPMDSADTAVPRGYFGIYNGELYLSMESLRPSSGKVYLETKYYKDYVLDLRALINK